MRVRVLANRCLCAVGPQAGRDHPQLPGRVGRAHLAAALDAHGADVPVGGTGEGMRCWPWGEGLCVFSRQAPIDTSRGAGSAQREGTAVGTRA
eukprot:5134540-Prymnesium_polylepis.1